MDVLRKDRSVSLFVFGCGLAFGLTGIYTYYKTRKTLKKEIRSMSLTIESLRSEIEELKSASQRGTPVLQGKGSPTKENQLSVRFADTTDGNNTPSDVESGDEEFYDFSESGNEGPLPNGNKEVSGLSDLTKDIDSMFENPSIDKEVVFEKISQAINIYGPIEKLVYRRVKACNYLVSKAAKENNAEGKKALAFKTFQLAKDALTRFPNSAECNKWYAIAVGGLSDFVSQKERIENGYVFKKHVDIAISLSPNDSTLHHLLGRFCDSIAALSWVERKIASTLFAEVPQATVEDALNHFLRAYQLRREWKENLLYLAKCCLAVKRWDEGAKYLNEGLSLPIGGEDDELAQNQLLTLKSKYRL